MKHIKIYEDYIGLNDLPYYKGKIKPKKESELKYKKDDIVKLKELNRHYIIKSLNIGSDKQDYYIYNPLLVTDKGWVAEEELSDPDENTENYKDVYLFNYSKKYNL